MQFLKQLCVLAASCLEEDAATHEEGQASAHVSQLSPVMQLRSMLLIKNPAHAQLYAINDMRDSVVDPLRHTSALQCS